MSIAIRGAFLALVAVAATGCNNGGDFIPLAKVDAPKEQPKAAHPPAAPKGVPTSPQELIYK